MQPMVEHTLDAYGFSLDDIRSWGGEVRYDPGQPYAPNRIDAVERGEIDAIFDEAVNAWGNMALDLNMRFLPLEEPILKKLEALGYRRALITKAATSKITKDVMSLDFSGWAVFTRATCRTRSLLSSVAASRHAKTKSPGKVRALYP